MEWTGENCGPVVDSVLRASMEPGTWCCIQESEQADTAIRSVRNGCGRHYVKQIKIQIDKYLVQLL